MSWHSHPFGARGAADLPASKLALQAGPQRFFLLDFQQVENQQEIFGHRFLNSLPYPVGMPAPVAYDFTFSLTTKIVREGFLFQPIQWRFNDGLTKVQHLHV